MYKRQVNISLTYNSEIEIINLSNNKIIISEGSNALRSELLNSFDYQIDNYAKLKYIDTNYYILDNHKKLYFEDSVLNKIISSNTMFNSQSNITLYSIDENLKIVSYNETTTNVRTYLFLNISANSSLKIHNPTNPNTYAFGSTIVSDYETYWQIIGNNTNEIILNKFDSTSFIASYTHSVSYLVSSTNIIMDDDYVIYSLFINATNQLKLLKFDLNKSNFTTENINSTFTQADSIIQGYHLNRSIAIICDSTTNKIHLQYSTINETHFGSNMGIFNNTYLTFTNLSSITYIENNNDKHGKFYFIVNETNGVFHLFTINNLFNRLIKLYSFNAHASFQIPSCVIAGQYLYISYNNSPYNIIIPNLIKYDLSSGEYYVRYNAFKLKTGVSSGIYNKCYLNDHGGHVCGINLQVDRSAITSYDFYYNIGKII